MVIPNWANEILISKGLGFERIEVKEVVWEYFEIQFGEFDCEQKMIEMYFISVVDALY
ncbi:hypothetical protein [Vibrio cholerae]|uniref:hypothetical protein n=1 Tax=Vibrio cholerae TaxID=666 RepID=UPI0029C1117D|nr:hypothetical protein [Vibrio cholerae]MDX5049951.1 hypothetical protein [Vibrio cholerae]